MNKLNFLAPITPNTSYGLCATQFLRGFAHKNTQVSLFPIGGRAEYLSEDAALVQKSINTPWDKHSTSLRLFHQFSLAEHVGSGKHIGFPIFELNRFKPQELNHLWQQDELIVCSEWARKVLKENGISVPCHVVPLGVDPTIFLPAKYEPSLEEDSPTVFLNVGKIEVRKGHDILHKAFNAAFSPRDNVKLKVAWHNFFLGKEESLAWENLYKGTPLGDKIEFIPRLSTQNELAQLMASVDCGVFPSRAEGWNLELLEMLSCGKHVIATNYSGHTEFTNRKNCQLIDIDSLEPAYDGVWFFGDGDWATFGEDQFDQLVDHMRSVHLLKQAGTPLYNVEGVKTAEKFSWQNSMEKLGKVLFP